MISDTTVLCDALPNVNLTSDCYNSSPVDCPCCIECCNPNDFECHADNNFAPFDPSWEYDFGRPGYYFGNHDNTDRCQLINFMELDGVNSEATK